MAIFGAAKSILSPHLVDWYTDIYTNVYGYDNLYKQVLSQFNTYLKEMVNSLQFTAFTNTILTIGVVLMLFYFFTDLTEKAAMNQLSTLQLGKSFCAALGTIFIMFHSKNIFIFLMNMVESLNDSLTIGARGRGSFDYEGIAAAINERTKLVTIQRSKGYATRPTLSVKRIGELISFIKNIKPDVICMVDNCYGEFVETLEPTDVGADMIVGSLIKNPGGGLAPIGGYIVGRKDCIERASYRLSAPGLGKEVGASLGLNQQLYQGLFLSPVVVSGALKGAIFAANIYERLGYGVVPDGSESRHDIIQAITFGTPEGVISFCKGIQAAAPVDSYVTPEPWDMPGYDSPVIMAAGAFVQGSSIELSADGPIKPPYAVYFQGGLTWYHAKLGILKSLQQLLDDGVLKILR